MKGPELRYQDRKGISNSRNSKYEKSEVTKAYKFEKLYTVLEEMEFGSKLSSEMWVAYREWERFFEIEGELSSASLNIPSDGHVEHGRNVTRQLLEKQKLPKNRGMIDKKKDNPMEVM